MKVTNLPFAVSFIKFNISFSIPIMKSLNEPDSSSIPSKSDELFTIVSIKVNLSQWFVVAGGYDLSTYGTYIPNQTRKLT